VEPELRPAVVKWCSESDVSVLEPELEPTTNERYDDCYDYDDFDMAFDLDDDLGLTQNIPRRKGTETVDMYVDRAHLRQLQTPAAVLRTKSQSTESFFEQPNEEGSLYMYGGRKRIAVKAPSAANIYDRVRGSIGSTERGRSAAGPKRGQCHRKPQLPVPSWRGGKRQEQAQNADKRQRYDNATNTNSNSNNSNGNNNSSNMQHKRQLTLESEKIVKVSGTYAAAIYRDRPYPTSIPNANKRSIVLLYLALRHEEVPVECESRIATRLSGSPAFGDAVPLLGGVCQVGERHLGVPHLGAHRQCGGHGYAEEQAAAR